MKFKDKDGKVFVDIEAAWLVWECPNPLCRRRPTDDVCGLLNTVCSREWAKAHPAEAAALMGYEVVEDEHDGQEANMDKQKPRICEVLGVEAGERFTAKTPYGDFTRCEVTEEGMVLTAGAHILCYIINHPESIIRQPRFTEEEVAVMRSLDAAVPGVRLKRYGDGVLFWAAPRDSDEDAHEENCLPYKMFPSIRPGESVRLGEIVGTHNE